MVVGGVSTAEVNEFLGIAAALTARALGLGHYGASLRGGTRKTIERATARGFFLGLIFSAGVLLVLVIL